MTGMGQLRSAWGSIAIVDAFQDVGCELAIASSGRQYAKLIFAISPVDGIGGLQNKRNGTGARDAMRHWSRE